MNILELLDMDEKYEIKSRYAYELQISWYYHMKSPM